MLKIKSILVSLLAIAALASCSKENDENPEVDGGKGLRCSLCVNQYD